jgi:hypothetical protein
MGRPGKAWLLFFGAAALACPWYGLTESEVDWLFVLAGVGVVLVMFVDVVMADG